MMLRHFSPPLLFFCRLRSGGFLFENAARVDGEFTYSRDFIEATREWFEQIIPRLAARGNLCLVQIENEYTVPTPLSGLPADLLDLLIRWFGSSPLEWLGQSLCYLSDLVAGRVPSGFEDVHIMALTGWSWTALQDAPADVVERMVIYMSVTRARESQGGLAFPADVHGH